MAREGPVVTLDGPQTAALMASSTKMCLAWTASHLQAKRYAFVHNTIGVEKIREFAGALDERRRNERSVRNDKPIRRARPTLCGEGIQSTLSSLMAQNLPISLFNTASLCARIKLSL